MSIRIAIIDDHTLVRAGIVALLRSIPDIEVVAEGANGAEAIRIARQEKPDVMLLDLAMPGVSGLDALPSIRAAAPGTKVVILSMHDSEEHVLRALREGANGYLLKDAAPAELGDALSTVMAGQTWLSRPISSKVIDGYAGRTARQIAESLTARQREVLRLIAEGYGTREISEILGLSIKTVETYRAQIMTRLDIRDVAGLVKFAIREGLTQL